MKKEIKLEDKKIIVSFKKSKRAKIARLAIHCNGDIVATVPENVSENIVESFIKKKANWIINKIARFKKYEVLPQGNYLRDKEEALVLIKDKIARFNQLYNFSFNRISVKKQKTRWGSCSKKKNLNFNYKILFLPEKMADYIIVHELCHLQELNHSRNFWNLVGQTMPDHKSIRKELKDKRL